MNRMTVALATAATLGLSGLAGAQTPYAGYTNGCFGFGCAVPNSSAFQTATLGGLTFENSTFTGTSSVSGFAAVGTNTNAQGVQDVDNFGAFYLNNTGFGYDGMFFSLLITFTVPGSGSSGTQYANALITGSVTTTDQGGVFIDFNNNPVTVNLSSGGFVQVVLSDVNVTSPTGNQCGSATTLPNTTCAPVTGHFSLVATPEPASMALVGTGLLGIGLGAFRRRNKKNA